jgi:glycosyltransferase involved in cell wall biosynthesis
MKKKVLHIISSTSWRGGEQQVHYLLNNISDKYEAYLFCVKDAAIIHKNQHLIHKIFTYKKRFGFDILAAIELKKICKKNKIDIIHLHDSHAINTYILADWLGNNIPAIIHRHVNFPIHTKWKYQYKKIQKIICVSNEVKKNFIPFIDDKKLEVIYPGIDVNKFQNSELSIQNSLKQELDISNETKLIGIISALEPEKNMEEFIKIAKKISSTRNDIKFVIIGDGSLTTKIKSEILHLKSYIFLLGFRDDIPQILSSLDIFLFTSKNEGFGQVLLEAMASKVPVITSNFGTAKEVIEDKKTGFIYKDINDAVQLIEKMLTTYDLQLTTITNAFNFVQQFDVKEMNEKINNLYETIIYNS